MGGHTFRGGYDFRLYKEAGFGPGASAGSTTSANYTRQLDNSTIREPDSSSPRSCSASRPADASIATPNG